MGESWTCRMLQRRHWADRVSAIELEVVGKNLSESVTAAHRTLPLGTVVRIVNVNDAISRTNGGTTKAVRWSGRCRVSPKFVREREQSEPSCRGSHDVYGYPAERRTRRVGDVMAAERRSAASRCCFGALLTKRSAAVVSSRRIWSRSRGGSTTFGRFISSAYPGGPALSHARDHLPKYARSACHDGMVQGISCITGCITGGAAKIPAPAMFVKSQDNSKPRGTQSKLT